VLYARDWGLLPGVACQCSLIVSWERFEIDIGVRRFLNQLREAEFLLPRCFRDDRVRDVREGSIAIAGCGRFRHYYQRRHGFDGSGAEGKHADVGIRGDRIAGVGDFRTAKAKTVIDATGLAVAPGFINMLSWSTVSLIQDGRSQSEIRQGVTTEIMGEGESMGPVNDRVRDHMLRNSIKCASSCAKKWKRARSGLALLSSIRRLFTRRPRS
jgi:hypothetical protein